MFECTNYLTMLTYNTYNTYDILSNNNQNKLVKGKVLIYLPSEYISTMLSMIEIKSTSFLSITKIRFDEKSNVLSFKGNECDTYLYTDCINDLLENLFMHYMTNEFGNIGKWADI